VANHHFANFADVWKHLLLTEVLADERPAGYAETHAGSAAYTMANDPERRFGAWHFVRAAPQHTVLARSRYLNVVTSFLQRPDPLYPGSALIAMSVLGDRARYLLCDQDAGSVADLRTWARRLDIDRCTAVRADGMEATARWLDSHTAHRAVVHVDPFDPYATCERGRSALELAAYVIWSGHVLVYWYGYDEPGGVAWAYDALRRLSGRPLWCGDAMVVDEFGSGAPGNLGRATTPGTGCGVVLANVADTTACGRLGRALVDAYDGATLPSGAPGGIRFTVPD
jgi:23S rRNA A2030 N6-methylase RlmJ